MLRMLAVGVALAVVPTAAASPALTMKRARAVARHERHLDANDGYAVAAAMGGPVHFGAMSCKRRSGRVVLCVYNVTRTTEDGRPGQLRCQRRVTVKLRAGVITSPVAFGKCGQTGA